MIGGLNMPFINVKTTAELDSAKKAVLNEELCRITKESLGKGENWVMTGYEGNVSLAFQGSTDDIAYVEVKAFGTPSAAGADKMTAGVCQLMERELGIPASRTYVSYWGTNQWGWNGGNL